MAYADALFYTVEINSIRAVDLFNTAAIHYGVQVFLFLFFVGNFLSEKTEVASVARYFGRIYVSLPPINT